MVNTNVKHFGKNLLDYLDQAALHHDVINVNTENGNVILMSEEEYNGMIETMYLLSIPGMKEKLLSGMAEPIEECDEFEW